MTPQYPLTAILPLPGKPALQVNRGRITWPKLPDNGNNGSRKCIPLFLLASFLASFLPPFLPLPPLHPSHTPLNELDWKQKRNKGTINSWHLSLLEILRVPRNKEGKASSLPAWAVHSATGTSSPPIPPKGRYIHLVNHSTCIRKHYLLDRKVAASLLEPQPGVRWISPKAPKPFPFYYRVTPHFNTY